MNEITKNIFIGEMDTVLARLESLPDGDRLLEQISEVTDPGNLRAVFANMKFFLEKGMIPESPAGSSSLPAIVFGLSELQEFFSKNTELRISAEDIRGMSAAYLSLYKKG